LLLLTRKIHEEDKMANMNENPSARTGQGANGPVSRDKLKDYGKKAYQPFIEILGRYQDEFTPYFEALATGLEAGAQKLTGEGAKSQEQYVANFFRESANVLNSACQSLRSKDYRALKEFIDEASKKNPSLIFSASYLMGMFFGKVGLQLVKKPSLTNEPPQINEVIH
jgi:hypothetical protein